MDSEDKLASFLFLGTGASSGIPVIGCSCPICSSSDPKNKRLRASSLITYKGRHILIDAGPDIRDQSLQNNIHHIDGVLLTHTHYDHVGGMEELRIFNFRQMHPLPCYLSCDSYEEIQRLLYYHFDFSKTNHAAQFDFHVLKGDCGTFTAFDMDISYFKYSQGNMNVLGYRFGDLAYVTDIKHYTEEVFSHLENLSILIISALRFTSSRMQFTVDEAIDFAEKTKAKKVYFMHLSHEVDHEALEALLPENFYLSYDGMKLNFTP